ncbi:hypothetical protein ABWH96_11770 [Marivirga tractuosa]|uniref:hypothetical protein n=1 Tax=Marivirga tractuosa TaxID=1006 RepID=UPI0035D08192
MNKEKEIFNDPNGKFVIAIDSTWKYNKNNQDKRLHQFEVSKECVFQISCRPINDRISKIIENKKIIPHDFSLPNLSYHEIYNEQDDIHSYIWMCQIDDHFIMSMYFYNPKIKPPKDIGLDLMGIRMSLQNIQYSREEKFVNKEAAKDKKGKKKDYLNIETWRNPQVKFLQSITKKDKASIKRISPVEIDVVKLYALLKCKVSQRPNGFYDKVRVGLPLDNMIWWDFVVECDKGYFQIWRTPHMIEAIFDFDEDFDLIDFLEKNIKKYSKEIIETIEKFDHHTIYINHYKSYKECVNTLWKEISMIDLTPPVAPTLHISKGKELENYSKAIPEFTEKSVKYHALAKSLVLNAAFEIESYLNLIIRVGRSNELRHYPEVLKKFLRQDFSYKIKNLRFYTTIFVKDFDLKSNEYRDAKELMTMRNKYVHFDEDSRHNKLGEILYDDNYPLHPTDADRPAIESIKKMFHKPEFKKVKNAYEVSRAFVNYLESLIHPEVRDSIRFLLDQNPIGYNENTGAYSAVNNPASIDFFGGFKEDSKSLE